MPSVSTRTDDATARVPLSTADDWPHAIVEPRSSPTVERLFRWRTGVVPGVVPYVCPHPWAYRPFLFLMNPVLEQLAPQLYSKVCFVVSRDNACRFCYGSFRTALRVAGYTEAELDRLEEELHHRRGSETTRTVLRFALTISRGRIGKGPSVAALREAGHAPTAIREIVGAVVLGGFVNRVGTMLAVPIDEAQEQRTDRWYFPVLRPLLGSVLAGWRHLQQPTPSPLREVDCIGPFADVLSHLRGTQVGRVLHAMATEWLDKEGALPRRTKLLMLAVVARGVDNDTLSERVQALLAEQCGLEASEVETVVTHLRGDLVQPVEEAVLPIARASILYEAGPLQHTVRSRMTNLSRDEIIEAVATLGLSNALARLHALAPLDE